MRPQLNISTANIRTNYRKFRSSPYGKPGAVLKADAYGLGAHRIAPLLFDEGCRDFFVAHHNEGIALRAVLGHAARIHIFEGVIASALPIYEKYDLLPVINSLDQLSIWAKAQHQARAETSSKPWLHFDTGMGRLGLDNEDIRLLTKSSQAYPLALVEGYMTHLACADQPDAPKNTDQLTLFQDVLDKLPPKVTSVGNSAATLTSAPLTGDLSRVGIGLFGGNPFGFLANDLLPVVKLTAAIQQIRELVPGQTVGYGAEYTADRRMKIATIGIGYADGIPRHLSKDAYVVAKDVHAPVIGRISMDAVTIDLSNVDPDQMSNLREVELIGHHIPLDHFASWCGTVGYEVLTSLGARVDRQYSDDAFANGS